MRAPVRSLPAGLDQSFTIAVIEYPAILATLHLVDASAFTVQSVECALLPRIAAEAGASRSFSDFSPGAEAMEPSRLLPASA
ncbi:hypothetical protein [Mesorhizobium sp.]|uniref:hypothetical protein n=1 Tax=Mesorhizobium sp. TaxID=1871066 RepID=UPI000FE81A8F|nr:hypothetical protein [Mesorhizobium sp.]RWK28222.1 MAG: hypothetical protein EOR46_33660 [Mesorhizobium sp.]RWK60237.1 MAG: hypothetical protein EOR54_34485 [Mesorhizobium sp.]RWK69237.1 MAG: hypothetical protein EOR50_35055 [Mesorhizobium sp.]RWK73774.1 MAG: hypothetical protein EOR51_34995 [Mesorhizobium sp.]RWL00263.1 MAG: hypothetical protein EOR55_29495 [Mesorhizobium sp.]